MPRAHGCAGAADVQDARMPRAATFDIPVFYGICASMRCTGAAELFNYLREPGPFRTRPLLM